MGTVLFDIIQVREELKTYGQVIIPANDIGTGISIDQIGELFPACLISQDCDDDVIITGYPS